MPRPARRNNASEPDGRPLKITLGEMRSTGARDPIVFCQDYRCGHNVKLSAAQVDKWPDEIRPSQIEPRFVCKACGQRGAFLRGGSEATMMAVSQ